MNVNNLRQFTYFALDDYLLGFESGLVQSLRLHIPNYTISTSFLYEFHRKEIVRLATLPYPKRDVTQPTHPTLTPP
jgi:hypothetical protein